MFVMVVSHSLFKYNALDILGNVLVTVMLQSVPDVANVVMVRDAFLDG